MNSESSRQFAHNENHAGIVLCNVQEALAREPRDLEVPEGTEVLLSPYEREHKEYFVRVELKSFEDLKMFGLVPRGLSEEKVRRAISKDDEEVHKLASKMLDTQARQGCGCEDHQPQSSRSYGSDLRRLYTSTRNRYHPSLANLLSAHLSARVEWDSALPGIIRRWVSITNVSLISTLFRDITINRGATLAVDKSAKSLLAGTIWIHRSGRLVSQGSYLKIWAHAISSFTDVKIIDHVTALDKLPWRGAN
jgi:hypothetical protein